MNIKMLLIGLLVSVLFLASCAIQPQPAGQPDQPLTPPVLQEETDTAPTATTTQVYQVVFEDGSLMPVDVEINSGDTVEWVNKDTVRYTLLSNGFEERLPVGGTFEQRFTEAGMVQYSAVEIEDDEDDRQEDRDNNLNDQDEGYNQEDSREDNQERELQGTIIVH